MKTTVLFVEHLIAGVLSLVWIALLFRKIYPNPALEKLPEGYNPWPLVVPHVDLGYCTIFVAFLALACCYILGVLQDRVADLFLTSILDSPLSRMKWLRVKSWRCVIWLAKRDRDRRMFILLPDNADEQIGKIRTQIRIVRSVVFTAPLIMVTVLLCVGTKQTLGQNIFILVSTVLLTVSAVIVYGTLDRTYETWLKQLARRRAATPPAHEDACLTR